MTDCLRRPYRHTRRQRGMTLVGFMVGMAVGLLVALAAVGSIIITRGSARSMTDSAALEQQATLVMTQIGRQISQTGAVNLYLSETDPDAGIPSTQVAAEEPVLGNQKIKFDTRNTGDLDKDNPVVSIFGTAGDASTPDTLTVSYAEPNDGTPPNNCNGTPALNLGGDSAPRVVNVFSVNTTTNELLCGSDDPATQQPIASNVVDMRVTYLLTGSDNVKYLTATQVTTNNDWAGIRGVQICLEMQGDPTQAPEQDYTGQRNCQGKPLTKKFTDGRIHIFVRQTFYLRNAY